MHRRGCSRHRLFKLIDGTGLDSQQNAKLIIYDFDHALSAEDVDQLKIEYSSSAKSSATTLQVFRYHRAFSGDEYKSPPTPLTPNNESMGKL